MKDDDEDKGKSVTAEVHLRKKILITGVTDTGEKFRPSDWAERMSGQLSTFKKRRIQYSPLLQPSMNHGHKCIVLDPALKNSNPELYDSIMSFAETNHLVINDEDQES